MNEKSKYEGKYFSVLGDSISTLAGYNPSEYAVFYDLEHQYKAGIHTPTDTWWGRVIEDLGGKLLVNNSFSGSTVCKHSFHEIPSYACSDERTAGLDRDGRLPDVIMIFMGINDWGNGTKVVSNVKVADELSVFSIAYQRMMEKLKKNYPQAELWCFTLPVSACTKRAKFVFPYCYGGRHIEEYCNAISRCAEQNGALLIDLYNPDEPYDTIDGFHPTAEGMQTLANAVVKSSFATGNI